MDQKVLRKTLLAVTIILSVGLSYFVIILNKKDSETVIVTLLLIANASILVGLRRKK
ncbi:hypothetical protein [Oceanidesulfovibrio indonesiensis]|uniref:hypothetical protein n=1 Tax=Oceanidesulfovibrio indonesiensis TaxID=54767 RepID=UPI0012948763|nr:hypothetical protein [Oceanidesulfovibrio indonesiensis]